MKDTAPACPCQERDPKHILNDTIQTPRCTRSGGIVHKNRAWLILKFIRWAIDPTALQIETHLWERYRAPSRTVQHTIQGLISRGLIKVLPDRLIFGRGRPARRLCVTPEFIYDPVRTFNTPILVKDVVQMVAPIVAQNVAQNAFHVPLERPGIADPETRTNSGIQAGHDSKNAQAPIIHTVIPKNPRPKTSEENNNRQPVVVFSGEIEKAVGEITGMFVKTASRGSVRKIIDGLLLDRFQLADIVNMFEWGIRDRNALTLGYFIGKDYTATDLMNDFLTDREAKPDPLREKIDSLIRSTKGMIDLMTDSNDDPAEIDLKRDHLRHLEHYRDNGTLLPDAPPDLSRLVQRWTPETTISVNGVTP